MLPVLHLEEIGLLCTLIIHAGIFACAYRFARRWGVTGLATLADAFLLYFAVQYVAVMATGAMGILHFYSLAAVAAGLCAAMGWGVPAANAPAPTMTPDRPERSMWWACAAIVAVGGGFVAALLWTIAYMPVTAEDAMTYHLPAAVRWLQTGRLGLMETWYFNPANTYSPLAGSTFAAWLIAPMGNETLARFVQLPPLCMLLVLMIRLGRELGAGPVLATLLGTAVCVSRPFLAEMLQVKDDVYLTAFFLAAALAATNSSLKDRLGPWRLGLAIGLMLATKYTAALSLPLFLLMIDAPWRNGWRWRQWGIALLAAGVIFCPWLARNLWLTGNPFYPMDVSVLGVRIFKGMFATQVSPDLRSWGRVGAIFSDQYNSPPVILWAFMAVWWLGACVRGWRRLRSEPLMRMCLLGPPAGIGLFLLNAPYAEVRFIFPSIVLMFACGAVTLRHARGGWRWAGAVAITAAAVQLGVAMYTCFNATELLETLFWQAAVVAAAAMTVIWLGLRIRGRSDAVKLFAIALPAMGLGMFAYIYWGAYEDTCRSAVDFFWFRNYGRGPSEEDSLPGMWRFVRENLPPGSVLAYANTHEVYPLLGYDYQIRAVYVPTRRAVERMSDLPHFPSAVTGKEMADVFTREMIAEVDAGGWLKRLGARNAKYLLVAKEPAWSAPELALAASRRDRFRVVKENSAAVVYEILSEK